MITQLEIIYEGVFTYTYICVYIYTYTRQLYNSPGIKLLLITQTVDMRCFLGSGAQKTYGFLTFFVVVADNCSYLFDEVSKMLRETMVFLMVFVGAFL